MVGCVTFIGRGFLVPRFHSAIFSPLALFALFHFLLDGLRERAIARFLTVLTLYHVPLQVSQYVNRKLMKPPTLCALELSYPSVMLMEAMRVCSAGALQDTAGAHQRMEQSGLGLELEEHPTVTSTMEILLCFSPQECPCWTHIQLQL